MRNKDKKILKFDDTPNSIKKFIRDNWDDVIKTELRPMSVAMCELELLNNKAIKENFGASLYFEKLKEALVKDIKSNPDNYNELTRDPDQTVMIVSPAELTDDGNNVRCVIITPFSLACFIEIEVSDYLYYQEKSVDPTEFYKSINTLFVSRKIGEA